ncbi:DUF2796 domain-containing protein [Flexibacterium corallicola]|uniref:DUF2796 domain-containing protein n=1 Tax=Flexibacterium corallicola TaxID=3037259 RepID=UPI00286ED1F2|nr:DUF2796 domain-containing protein [Pseudovibrio sp. M1P-2-3]
MRLTPIVLCAAFSVCVSSAFAQEIRHVDAHEHGHGKLNISIDGNSLLLELEAPGYDLVGFEHEAETAEEKTAMTDALDKLNSFNALFVLPEAAQCSVVSVQTNLVDEEEELDHGHSSNGAEHEEHHAEFSALYELTCANIGELTQIEFPYFTEFKNAEELEVQLVTPSTALKDEVSRSAPLLKLAAAARN